MAKKSTEEQLQELIKKQAIIKNRIASIEAKKRNLDDKILTRKKILIGAYILEKHKDNKDEMHKLHKELGDFLTRDNDRALFKLAPIGKTQKSSSKKS